MNANRVSLGGVVTALSIVVLWFGNIFIFNRLVLLAVTSLLIAFMVIETNRKTAGVVYIAVSILAYFLVPNKIMVLDYIVLFGNYAIVKHIFEVGNRKKLINYLLKASYFNIMAVVIALLANKLLGLPLERLIDLQTMAEKLNISTLDTKLLWVGLGIGYQIVWLIVDYVFSAIINIYYQRRMQRK